MNHAQEARGALEKSREWLEDGETARANLATQRAQVHATLALVEQQRIANLIALLQYTGRIPEAAAHEIQDELFAVGGALTREARTALGLGDTND